MPVLETLRKDQSQEQMNQIRKLMYNKKCKMVVATWLHHGNTWNKKEEIKTISWFRYGTKRI